MVYLPAGILVLDDKVQKPLPLTTLAVQSAFLPSEITTLPFALPPKIAETLTVNLNPFSWPYLTVAAESLSAVRVSKPPVCLGVNVYGSIGLAPLPESTGGQT